MARRKPYAYGTQDVTDFGDNVKKNNNGKNGNGTGNKSATTRDKIAERDSTRFNTPSEGLANLNKSTTVKKLQKELDEFIKTNRPQ